MLIDVHGNFYAPGNGVAGNSWLNERYLECARRVGITQVVGKVMGSWAGGTRTYVPSGEEMRCGNRFMLELMQAHPGFVFGYVFVNPALGDEACAELAYGLGHGMIGLKLGAAVRCTSPLVEPLIEICIAGI